MREQKAPEGPIMYEKAGFRPIGRRRQAHRLAGRAYDVLYMDALATEFDGAALGQRPSASRLRRRERRPR